MHPPIPAGSQRRSVLPIRSSPRTDRRLLPPPTANAPTATRFAQVTKPHPPHRTLKWVHLLSGARIQVHRPFFASLRLRAAQGVEWRLGRKRSRTRSKENVGKEDVANREWIRISANLGRRIARTEEKRGDHKDHEVHEGAATQRRMSRAGTSIACVPITGTHHRDSTPTACNSKAQRRCPRCYTQVCKDPIHLAWMVNKIGKLTEKR